MGNLPSVARVCRRSWSPIPHIDIVTQVNTTIRSNGLIVGTLAHDGTRYFGLMEIQHRESDQDYCRVLGLRNSRDKMFPAGIVAGSSVFCCDYLLSSSKVKLARKNARLLMRNLPLLGIRHTG